MTTGRASRCVKRDTFSIPSEDAVRLLESWICKKIEGVCHRLGGPDLAQMRAQTRADLDRHYEKSGFREAVQGRKRKDFT